MSSSVLLSAREHRSEGAPRGARVLVTGVSARRGISVAQAFASEGAFLAVHTRGDDAKTRALLEAIGTVGVTPATAGPTHLTGDIADPESAVRLVQRAAASAGRLDTVINLVDVPTLPDCASAADAEAFVSKSLLSAVLMTRIAANRMRLMRREGLILNVVQIPQPETRGERALAGLLGAALAAMTRGEAHDWAGSGIRINAVGPADALGLGDPTGAVADEDDLAYLATYLAGPRGLALSGIVFPDAPHPRCC